LPWDEGFGPRGALGQRHREGRATTWAVARRIYRPASQLHHSFDQRQPQIDASEAPRRRRIRRAKAVEDEGQEFRLDAIAGVVDRDADALIRASHTQLDAS
jgi:hypothetical protein